MNSLLHRETDEDVEDTHTRTPYSGANGRDREITLGTTMVLGIFFALAVFGAVFFGIGYSLGSKRAATLAAAPIVDGSAGNAAFNNFKPAPGSPLGAPAMRPAAPDAFNQPLVPTPVAATAVASTRPTPTPIQAAAAPEDDAPARPAARTPAAAAALPTPAAVAAGPGTSVVQVAAVSHQEDADLLVSTLKRRGYAVAIRNEPQDKLLHVQIGPFANRKDADVMRQKLLADGFNAIVK